VVNFREFRPFCHPLGHFCERLSVSGNRKPARLVRPDIRSRPSSRPSTKPPVPPGHPGHPGHPGPNLARHPVYPSVRASGGHLSARPPAIRDIRAIRAPTWSQPNPSSGVSVRPVRSLIPPHPASTHAGHFHGSKAWLGAGRANFVEFVEFVEFVCVGMGVAGGRDALGRTRRETGLGSV
jgi:hypothetical protein